MTTFSHCYDFDCGSRIHGKSAIAAAHAEMAELGQVRYDCYVAQNGA